MPRLRLTTSTCRRLIEIDVNPYARNAMTADFIEVYDNALPRDACAALIERFLASGEDKPGSVGGGVLPDLKDSRDISITGKPAWRDAEAQLNNAVFGGLMTYLRRYPHTLIAPLMLEVPGPGGKSHRLTPERLQAMDDAALSPVVQTVFRP